MKSLFRKIKNLVPYLLLIAIYFFFINIEAQKNRTSDEDLKINKHINDEKAIERSTFNDSSMTIPIPVIPFNQ